MAKPALSSPSPKGRYGLLPLNSGETALTVAVAETALALRPHVGTTVRPWAVYEVRPRSVQRVLRLLCKVTSEPRHVVAGYAEVGEDTRVNVQENLAATVVVLDADVCGGRGFIKASLRVPLAARDIFIPSFVE